MADSIRAQGLIQPIVVRPLPARDPAGARQYEIVAGERRWRAAQLAGLDAIPAMVKDLPDSAAIAVALIENIQRENLGPLEEAAALRRLIDEFDLTHEAAAEAIGRSQGGGQQPGALAGSRRCRPRNVVPEGQTRDGPRACALLALSEDPRKQADLAVHLIVKHERSRCGQTESPRQAGDGLARPKSSPCRPGPVDPDIRQLQDELAEQASARGWPFSTVREGRMAKLVVSL